MSAHARFPVDPEDRIPPDKLDVLADAADDLEWRRALRQAARDARTLAALREWLKRRETHRPVAVKLDEIEAQVRDQLTGTAAGEQ